MTHAHLNLQLGAEPVAPAQPRRVAAVREQIRAEPPPPAVRQEDPGPAQPGPILPGFRDLQAIADAPRPEPQRPLPANRAPIPPADQIQPRVHDLLGQPANLRMFVEDDDAAAGLGAEDATPATNNKKISLPPLVPGFKANCLDAGKSNPSSSARLRPGALSRTGASG